VDDSAPAAHWPALVVSEWEATRDTLQLYTQVVGKVRMVNEPLSNHWWNVPLYLTARGLTTSLMPHPTGTELQIDFDFVDHRLDIATTGSGSWSMALEPKPVAEFYREVMQALEQLGVSTEIWPVPVEIPDAIPFTDDQTHSAYDADAVHRFWRLMIAIESVMKRFRTRFVGKASPIHYFWGAIDLAHTRFSGRTAPPHPGGAPNCGPHVMWEAYSHEVSSCGYWPGGPSAEGIFYAYAYPDPPDYREVDLGIDGARWDSDLGEFILPYELVRTATDPDQLLLDFLQRTYEAAADTGSWDRAALERPDGVGGG
jgi:hypothetical protein